MIYTVHVGLRADPWPPQVATAATRGEAQEIARAALRAAPADVTKAEVRLRVVLLDAYSKRPSGAIRPVYAAKQRAAAPAALALPLGVADAVLEVGS